MIVATAAQAAQERFRVDSHGAGAWIHPYFGTGAKQMGANQPQAGAPYPMLYLVEQDASTTIPTHFHQVSQFQVVVRGQGRLGAHALEPVTVHYTNAFTGYGPLAASSAGMGYLTVRNCFDPGLKPLPQARDELDAARKTPAGRHPLNIVAQPAKLQAEPASLARQSHHAKTLLSDSCGAAAHLHTWPADAQVLLGPAVSDSVWVLLDGAATVDSEQHQRLSPLDAIFLLQGERVSIQMSGVTQWLELIFPV
jgi:hypothetical protein